MKPVAVIALKNPMNFQAKDKNARWMKTINNERNIPIYSRRESFAPFLLQINCFKKSKTLDITKAHN
jgi:hypothetical protein